MRIHHVVWDWNGTLLDDVTLIAQATSQCLGALGCDPLDVDTYRAAYRRPIHEFYEHLLGRALGPGEFERLDREWHDLYVGGVADCHLFEGVEQALDRVHAQGWTQSICSMYPHDELGHVVAALGVTGRFLRIDGISEERRGGRKADHLRDHLAALRLSGEQVVVIGDSLDDAEAAEACGAAAILLTTGLHHPDHLETAGVPVAHSVLDALAVVESGVAVAVVSEGV
jgi:phosphoglycolate phosphatase-like HAD superfamily hydrolase